MLEVFQNEEFGTVRAIEEGDKVLFCATDVAKALGYSNQRDAIGRHCKGVVKRDTLTSGGMQELSFRSKVINYMEQEQLFLYRVF